MSTLVTSHIEIDAEGQVWIAGANTKVIEIVLDKLAYGWSPEETHFQHPHLSLAQIHAALSYYYDHQAEIEAEIEKRYQNVEALRERAKNSPFQKRLSGLAKQK